LNVKLSLVAFCLAELVLLGYGRAASTLAHARAAQTVVPVNAGSAAALCAEANAAVAESWPAVPLLNAAGLVPLATTRAWGQVPPMAEALHRACQAVDVYANIVPSADASIDDGVAADLLTEVRAQRAQIAFAGQQLTQAWSLLDTIDVAALAAEPRLARPTRLLTAAQAQQADVLDMLTVATPERIETLLGGLGPRALVLASADRGPDAQAFALIQEGRVVAIEAGQPAVQPVAVITLDDQGLTILLEAKEDAQLPGADRSASFGSVAQELLHELTRARLAANLRVAAALKQSADQHHAWLSFEDPALQALAARRGWVRQ
jgi:hypothetical protein